MLKICWPGALESLEQHGTYVHCITGYFLEVADGLDLPVDDLHDARAAAVRTVEDGEDLDGLEERFVGATLVADAHWMVPIITWMPLQYRLVFRLMEDMAAEKLFRLAKQHVPVGTFHVPTFSFADDVVVDGMPVTERVSGRERMFLGASIMHAEWFDYIASEVGLDIDEGLFARSREGCARYYAGDKEELSPDVAALQKELFRGDAVWFERVMDEFGFGSWTLRHLARLHRQQAERMDAML